MISPNHELPVDLVCAHCGYNLRGHEGDPRRCPECGTVNTVRDMLNARRGAWARRSVAISFLYSVLAFTLLNAWVWLIDVIPQEGTVSFRVRIEGFALAESGPVATLIAGGFSPLYAFVLILAIPAIVVTALLLPKRKVLVALAHLSIGAWFLHGCVEVAGLVTHVPTRH